MDRLIAMHVFVRVVEAGSFSAAARESNTTQSAISKHVAALERYLGAKLLLRSTRALSLTDEGARYFEQARRLLAEVAEAEDLVRHGAQQLHGCLRVAAPVGFGLRELMPHVRAFLAIHPNVRIDLRLNDNLIDLIDQGVDLAVRIGRLADSALFARRIADSHGVLMASTRYLNGLPPGQGVPQVPADLANHACIVYTELSSRNVWRFHGIDGGEVKVPVSGPLQSNSSEAVRAALLDGMGIVYGPRWMARDALASGDVKILLPEWTIAPLPIHIVSPLHRRHVAKVRAFSDFLAQALSASAPGRNLT